MYACVKLWTAAPQHTAPYHSHSLIILCFVGAEVSRVSEAGEVVGDPEDHRGHPQHEVHIPGNMQRRRKNLHRDSEGSRGWTVRVTEGGQ